MGRKSKRRKQQDMAARKRENASCKELIQTMEIPLLRDDNTIGFVKNSRVMIIMRGLPGSGKSTIVRLIQNVYSKTVVCSADDYFVTAQGTYAFDQDKLKEAHEACQAKALLSCENGVSPVVIDNTCVRRWELSHYVKLADAHGYIVVLLEPQTPWKHDPAELAKRNKHEVTEEVLTQKLASYELVVPYYFAWRLNQKASNRIHHEAEKFFNKCLKNVPELAAQLEAALSTDGPGLNYTESYQVIPAKPLHCTAFFSKRGLYEGKNHEGVPYHDWPVVKRSLGKSYGLEVIGFVITPRTVGARLRLSERQKRLWNKDDTERAKEAVASVTDSIKSLSMSGTKKKTPSQFQPTFGQGSRAHFTIGFTKGYSAVQTGLDLVEIISLEDKNSCNNSFHDLNDAKARSYGKGQCVVYLNEPIKVSALFTGHY